METFALHNSNGELVAFEIPSSYFITSGGVARYLARCPGVRVTKVRQPFTSDEIHVQFTLEGEGFEVWEPFGDNSRYWIGPVEDAQRRRQCIDNLLSYVRQSWPGPISAVRGPLAAFFRRSAGA